MLLARYGDDLYSRGLNVTLSVRADEQQVAYKALRKGLLEYERRPFYRGPEAHADMPADPRLVDGRGA